MTVPQRRDWFPSSPVPEKEEDDVYKGTLLLLLPGRPLVPFFNQSFKTPHQPLNFFFFLISISSTGIVLLVILFLLGII